MLGCALVYKAKPCELCSSVFIAPHHFSTLCGQKITFGPTTSWQARLQLSSQVHPYVINKPTKYEIDKMQLAAIFLALASLAFAAPARNTIPAKEVSGGRFVLDGAQCSPVQGRLVCDDGLGNTL